MPKQKQEIVVSKNYSIESVEQVTQMANVLKKHIVSNKLFTGISGRNYVHVEGWQFAGGLLGLFPKMTSVENMSNGTEYKWRATVEIVNVKTGQVLATGTALCSNKEGKKKSFDEYAVLSMAQTRAIGKAYRNLLGWVMKLAGYEGTPAEEMPENTEKINVKKETAVQTEDPRPEFFCVNHEEVSVSKAESEYSIKHFGKSLCRNCQKEAKTK